MKSSILLLALFCFLVGFAAASVLPRRAAVAMTGDVGVPHKIVKREVELEVRGKGKKKGKESDCESDNSLEDVPIGGGGRGGIGRGGSIVARNGGGRGGGRGGRGTGRGCATGR